MYIYCILKKKYSFFTPYLQVFNIYNFAHGRNERVAHVSDCCAEALAEDVCSMRQVLGDEDVQSCEGHSAAERIAAIGASMLTGLNAKHNVPVCENC